MNDEEMYIKRVETGAALKELAMELERQRQYGEAKGVRKAMDRVREIPVIYVSRGAGEEE